ncbi:MAG: DUF6687 family protein [bacterium]
MEPVPNQAAEEASKMESGEKAVETKIEAAKTEITESLEERKKAERSLEQTGANRRLILLDFVRRGLRKADFEAMPEIIDAFPDILATKNSKGQPMVDVLSKEYDEQAMKDKIIRIFKDIETQTERTDALYRHELSAQGIKVKEDIFIDPKRYKFVQETLSGYLASITPESLKKVKTDDPKKSKKLAAIKKIVGAKFFEMDEAEVETLLSDAESGKVKLPELSPPTPEYDEETREFSDAVYAANESEGKYNPATSGFERVPKMSEYQGEIFKLEDADFESVTLRPNVEINMKRGTSVPVSVEIAPGRTLVGSTIIDGNLGRVDSGELKKVEGINIIDHHDRLEEDFFKRGEEPDLTATKMITHIISDSVKESAKELGSAASKQDIWKLAMKKYLERFGAKVEGSEKEIRKLRVFVNHLDSDSVLSLWAFRNPRLALKHKHTINAISNCGDFLLGSKPLERGASARDYEYILRNIITDSTEKLKAPEYKKLQEVRSTLETQLKEMLGDDTANLDNAAELLKHQIDKVENADETIASLKKQFQTAPGSEKKKLNEALKAAKNANPELKKLEAQTKKIQDAIKAGTALKEKISVTQKRGPTAEENLKLLNFILDNVEDILQNPFKYQECIKQERAKEEKVVEDVESLYKKGEIDIRPDLKDEGIVVIEPTGGRGPLYKPESIDGMYFAFRRRVDFNQPIIMRRGDGYVSAAINTQNARDLKKYNFNELVEEITKTERTECQARLEESEKAGDKKAVASLKEHLAALLKGEVWRNRTQMIFSGLTKLSFENVMELVRKWKKSSENPVN